MEFKPFLLVIAAAGLGIAAGIALQPSFAQEPTNVLTRASVLHDPEIPDLGNPKGDVTIVEYFDYQCPYCKAIAPVIDQVAKDDGKIRIVLKDWPIFGEVSNYAARIIMAAKYQNRFKEAHSALMGAKGKLTEARVLEILGKAGVDTERITADVEIHRQAIDDLMARNNSQAEAFGFQGTPAFIIGTFRVPGVLDANGFKQAIADARATVSRSKGHP